jgi:heat shock protein HslJ
MRLAPLLIAALLAAPGPARALDIAQAARPEAQQQPPPAQRAVPPPPAPGQFDPQRRGPPRIGERLAQTRWRAESLRGRPVPKDLLGVQTLEFLEDGFVRGETGCNRFVGPFATRANRAVLGPLSLTRRACAQPALSQQETAFVETLERTERAELREGDQVLLLYSSLSDKPSRFVRQP